MLRKASVNLPQRSEERKREILHTVKARDHILLAQTNLAAVLKDTDRCLATLGNQMESVQIMCSKFQRNKSASRNQAMQAKMTVQWLHFMA